MNIHLLTRQKQVVRHISYFRIIFNLNGYPLTNGTWTSYKIDAIL